MRAGCVGRLRRCNDGRAARARRRPLGKLIVPVVPYVPRRVLLFGNLIGVDCVECFRLRGSIAAGKIGAIGGGHVVERLARPRCARERHKVARCREAAGGRLHSRRDRIERLVPCEHVGAVAAGCCASNNGLCLRAVARALHRKRGYGEAARSVFVSGCPKLRFDFVPRRLPAARASDCSARLRARGHLEDQARSKWDVFVLTDQNGTGLFCLPRRGASCSGWLRRPSCMPNYAART